MIQIRLYNAKFGENIANLASEINETPKKQFRSKDYSGVVYEVVVAKDFFQDTKAFLNNCYERDGGIDCIVRCLFYEYIPNDRQWQLWFEGLVQFNAYDKGDESLSIAVEQTGIQRNVINLMNVDVDLETEVSHNGQRLSENPAVWPTYHSQNIVKESNLVPANTTEHQDLDVSSIEVPASGGPHYLDVVMYGQLATDGSGDLDDIETTFKTPYGYVTMDAGLSDPLSPGSEADYEEFFESHKTPRNEIVRFDEPGTILELAINLKLKHTVTAVNPGGDIDACDEDGALGSVEIKAWYELRDVNNTIKDIQLIGSWNMDGACGTNEKEGTMETKSLTLNDIEVAKGDKLYVFETVRVYGDYTNSELVGSDTVTHNVKVEPGSIDDDPEQGPASYINITFNSIDVPRKVKTVMIFEAVKRCVEYITNQENVFESSLLGRPDLGYDETGDAALIGITGGKNMRNNIAVDDPIPTETDKIITNLGQLLKLLDVQHCIGFGFEKRDGRTILVLERKSYFFDKDNTSISLGNVAELHEVVNNEMFYNQVEFGYSGKLNLNETNAKFEFNTTRKYVIPIANAKGTLKILTDVRVSGYEIENQKRLRNNTKDSQNDDELFAISMNDDGPAWTTKDGSSFTVTGLPDAATAYNLEFSPRRIIENWKQYISSMLIRSRSQVLTFADGGGNYTMTSQKAGETDPLAEDSAIDVSQEVPIWDCMNYTFEKTGITREQVVALGAGPYKVIELRDRNNNLLKGFIDPVGIELNSEEKTATFSLLKAYIPSNG